MKDGLAAGCLHGGFGGQAGGFAGGIERAFCGLENTLSSAVLHHEFLYSNVLRIQAEWDCFAGLLHSMDDVCDALMKAGFMILLLLTLRLCGSQGHSQAHTRRPSLCRIM